MNGPPSTPQRAVVGVGALLLRPDGALLIGHRVKHGETESWCLPGGHVEPGESFESAALREISEEAGIGGVLDAGVFAVLLDTGRRQTRVTAGVLAYIGDANASARILEPQVFSSWMWVVPAELPHPLFAASAALIAAWQGKPLPQGWIAYATSAGPAAMQSGGVR